VGSAKWKAEAVTYRLPLSTSHFPLAKTPRASTLPAHLPAKCVEALEKPQLSASSFSPSFSLPLSFLLNFLPKEFFCASRPLGQRPQDYLRRYCGHMRALSTTFLRGKLARYISPAPWTLDSYRAARARLAHRCGRMDEKSAPLIWTKHSGAFAGTTVRPARGDGPSLPFVTFATAS